MIIIELILPTAKPLSLAGVNDNRLSKGPEVPSFLAFSMSFSLASKMSACLWINSSANVCIALALSSAGSFCKTRLP